MDEKKAQRIDGDKTTGDLKHYEKWNVSQNRERTQPKTGGILLNGIAEMGLKVRQQQNNIINKTTKTSTRTKTKTTPSKTTTTLSTKTKTSTTKTTPSTTKRQHDQ